MRTVVRGPDGGFITVEHPEGASDEQIIAYAQKNYAPTPTVVGKEGLAAAAKEIGDLGLMQKDLGGRAPLHLRQAIGGAAGDLGRRFATGIGTSANRLASAIIPGVDDKDVRDVAAATSEGAGGLATAGDVGTSVATTLSPAAKMAGLVSATARFLPRALAAGGTGATLGAVTTPGDISTQEGLNERLAGAGMSALGGVGGQAGTSVLSKALTGIAKPSPAGRELMEAGVRPTLGQGAASPFYRRLEDAIASLPLGRTIVQKGQMRAMNEANEAMLTNRSPSLEAAATSMRVSPGNQLTRTGVNAYLLHLLGIPIHAAAPVVAGASLAGTTPQVAKAALGGYEGQKALAKALRSAGFRGATAATITSQAVKEEERD